MSCDLKQTTITNLTKVFMRDLRGSGLSHDELKAKASSDAVAIVEARYANEVEEFAAEADARAALPGGVVLELNAEKPTVYSPRSKSQVRLTVTEVNNNKVYGTIGKGTTVFSYTPGLLTLNQKDAQTIINKYTVTPIASEAISSNATDITPASPSKQSTVAVSKEVQLLNEQYLANPTSENKTKLMNAEIAHGYRNTKGELLVKFTAQKELIKSADITTEVTDEGFNELYVDTDGTISKSANLNKAFIAADKINMGENFDESHSEDLTALLANIEALVYEINDKEVKLKPITLKDATDPTGNTGAAGSWNPNTDVIELYTDTHGAGADFRNNFSMTNQEVYAHEMIHAVMDFIFNKDNAKVGKSTTITSLKSSLESLFAKASKESTWKTLLPGIDDNVVYTEQQKLQAQVKWQYIFRNPHGYGLHEFMASIMTNSMFREGMKSIGSLSTVIDTEDNLADQIRAWFNKIFEKLFGYMTNKRDNTITKEGTRLIIDLMRANYNAVERVSMVQVIKSVDNVYDLAVNKMDVANESFKKLTDPFVRVIDSLEDTINGKASKHLSLDMLKEFTLLRDELVTKLTKINTRPDNSGSSFVNGFRQVIKMIYKLGVFITAMPALFKMRKLVKGSKYDKNVGKYFTKIINDFLTAIGLAEENGFRVMLRDFIDRPGLYNFLADSLLRLTHAVDVVRETTFTAVKGELLGGYEGIHMDNDLLNLRNNEAHLDVILRTDLQVLGLDAEGLLELLRNPDEVKAKIAELSVGLHKQVIKGAKQLAKGMVTGVGVTSNAENVARSFGFEYQTAVDPDIIMQTDKLITYLALDITAVESKAQMVSFLDGSEYKNYSNTIWRKIAKKNGIKARSALTQEQYTEVVTNGMNLFLMRAIGLNAASKEEMAATPHLRIKGYVKDVYRTKDTIEMLPMSKIKEHEANGYVLLTKMPNVVITTDEYGMFVNKMPAIKRANGTLGLQDSKARGLTLRDLIHRESNDADIMWDDTKKRRTFESILPQMVAQYHKNPESTPMSPMYDANGRIVDFRYNMSIADKKKYLDLDTRGIDNMARSYSTMGTAKTTAAHNHEVVDLLVDDYLNNYTGNEESYVVIKPLTLTALDYELETYSTEAMTEAEKYSHYWARLPKDTKEYATKKFAGKQLILRKEFLTIAFGDDDFSITQLKMFNKTKPKTKILIRQIESGWQDLMQIAKSNIVIKTPAVFTGNIWSNLKILVYVGVHPIKGAELMLLASKELKRYETDNAELGKLKRDRLSGIKDLDVRITEIEAKMKENLVYPLITAGLYQSIVEDVTTSTKLNTVGQYFDDKLNKYVTNDTANSVIQMLFMTQKTKPYQQMLKLTQVSDFYFRFAQYYDAIDNKGHSPERALRDAIDNYINYEVPLEKHVRYMDTIGSWFFIKYFVKVQRVIKKFATQHPLKMATDLMLQQFAWGDTEGVENSFWATKIWSKILPFNQYSNLKQVIVPSGADLVL